MRRLIAATCAAGLAIVVASPAIAGAPPPAVPSDAAIDQYIEVVPSAEGPVPIGEAASPAVTAPLPTAVRAKVERTAGADGPALLELAQDARFGARPVRRANPTRAREIPRQSVPASTGTPTPSPLAAAASTAGSGELLLVVLMLIAITAAGIAARVRQR